MEFIIFLIITFIAALFFYKPNLTSYVLWLAICGALYCIFTPASAFIAFIIYGIAGFIHSGGFDTEFSGGSGSYTVSASSYEQDSDKPFWDWKDRRYSDGSYRTEGWVDGTYHYSDGTTSYTSLLGHEVRSNGETVMDNGFIPGKKDIYKDNRRVGYEYEDWLGITHRVDEE